MTSKDEAHKGPDKQEAKTTSKGRVGVVNAVCKGPESPGRSVSLGANKRKDAEVTVEMKTSVAECKKLIKSGSTKAEAARKAFAKLKGLERRQIMWVFTEGCALSRAGAGTYYQNCKKS